MEVTEEGRVESNGNRKVREAMEEETDGVDIK